MYVVTVTKRDELGASRDGGERYQTKGHIETVLEYGAQIRRLL